MLCSRHCTNCCKASGPVQRPVGQACAGALALPGTLGYLVEDEFIHFAPVALWWWREGFAHAFDNRMNAAFDEHDVLHVLSDRPGVAWRV